ncbi:hypothetical protein LTR09_007036 [Extremus antarcticus]|uniref:Uncharacterized protein n=1 Tax=Extremus antarcticus TaxID=702011 RepID=A0AAJ0G816_9PEZI|nr:hypothetical protein LTR09_007036 [Extremus antarcticus]
MASKPPCDYIDEGSSSPDEDDSEFFSSAGEDDDGNYDMFTGAVVSTVGDTTFDQSRTELLDDTIECRSSVTSVENPEHHLAISYAWGEIATHDSHLDPTDL